jgi:hypothetical protein
MKLFMPIRVIVLVLSFGLLNLTTTLAVPIRVLFIGNSYTYVNDLPAMTTWLASKEKRTLETTTIAEGGYTLEQHWNAGKAIAAIRQGRWDFVVLQEQSTRAVQETASYQAYVRAFELEIRKIKAKTVLYLTWARRDMGNPLELQASWTKQFMLMAKELKTTVAPVGEAWLKYLQAGSGLDLYQEDGSHPSYAGTYLAACVFYATFYGKSPVGLAAPEANVTKKDALKLQQMAWAANRALAVEYR